MCEVIVANKVFIDSAKYNEPSKLIVVVDFRKQNNFNDSEETIWGNILIGKSLFVRFQRKSFFNNQAIYEAVDFSENPPEEQLTYFVNTIDVF
ncbi:hypothetical protein COMNV_01635 [Commensalibacter sp. Nvir]|uniref:hypothetical protein n=1 Tax=Commensalibacter sp. Nvir TaxID=3069817 RepID=UPI002D4EF442|nr:hypothetical protein COMNV_01635 [Commensalibacter sp. Nvir]